MKLRSDWLINTTCRVWNSFLLKSVFLGYGKIENLGVKIKSIFLLFSVNGGEM